MFICSKNRNLAIGAIVRLFWTMDYALILPPQPVRVLRHATRDEFIAYCKERQPQQFARYVERYGPPPFDERYYEVTTD